MLDRIEPDRSALHRTARLECARLARQLTGRLEALSALLLAEADQAQASLRTAGTPTTSWLGVDQKLSRREAAGALFRAKERAEQVLVDLAGTLDADQLAKAAGRVLREVAPRSADELLEIRLQREAEAAGRNRSLRFFRDGGSVRFDGSLPRVEAEAWMAMLLGEAAGAGLIADDQQISAGELRRLCCDAELIPVVLGGPSEVLDVGREHRLVTPAIHTALVLRHGGCTFPTCTARPGVCEAHHVVPWRLGGITALSDLVLMCKHHHGIVEPAKYGTRDQWEVRLAMDGVPEFIPPARLDPERRPMRHARFSPDPYARTHTVSHSAA